ncbi:MAG: glutamyl-tRNA reductase [Bryobacteraceae bacterium]|nr:glutamyl-tRNA reductase [Bryobacteraceae bacterium]MDW8380384.1 glutamyl-tRNA reductase [Bryobacterales bacterium]
MTLHITGLNHRTAPVEVRERLAFPAPSLSEALRQLISLEGVQEGIILSTCNRVEVAAVLQRNDGAQLMASFLESNRQVAGSQFRAHLYHYEGTEAIRHLFRVASSLDSMVVGEPQILGQLKEAYAQAKAAGTLGGFLEPLLSRAFNVAKRVRTETGIGQSAVSVSYAAVELAREIFGSLRGHAVLLIGAGKMSELAARHLQRAGASKILVANRTLARAQEMAALFSGSVVPYDKVQSAMHTADIVITSSGAPHYILTRDSVQRVMAQRRGKPIFLIDIAVPRNIEPAVNELDNVFLYDMDDLGRLVERNRLARSEEAAQAEKIIEEEVARTVARLREREVTPVIVRLQEQLEQMRCAELERVRSKLGDMTPQQQEAIEALTKSLLAKIAHGPITELRRQASQGELHSTAELIRRMFRLPAQDLETHG